MSSRRRDLQEEGAPRGEISKKRKLQEEKAPRRGSFKRVTAPRIGNSKKREL